MAGSRSGQMEKETEVVDPIWLAHAQIGTPAKFANAWLGQEIGFNKEMRQMCIEYCADWPALRSAGRGMVLAGPSGTGKTFSAAATLHGIHKRYNLEMPINAFWFSAVYSMQEMMDAKHFNNKDKYIDLYKKLTSYSLVVIDDLLHVADYVVAKQLMFAVYEARDQANLATITTMNGTFGKDDYGNVAKVFNEPFARKLVDNCTGFVLST